MPRLADELLAEALSAAGAVLVEGPRACGKTATARRAAASEVLLDSDDAALAMAEAIPGLLSTRAARGRPPRASSSRGASMPTRVRTESTWIRSRASVPDTDARSQSTAGPVYWPTNRSAPVVVSRIAYRKGRSARISAA